MPMCILRRPFTATTLDTFDLASAAVSGVTPTQMSTLPALSSFSREDSSGMSRNTTSLMGGAPFQ